MSAKRYFQMAYLWPVVAPAVIAALAGVIMPDWIGEVCKGALRWGAIPAALFATGMLLWSVDKDSVSVRRSTYLAPLLFSPVLAVYLLTASGPLGSPHRPDQLIVSLLMCGIVLVVSVVTVGYSYVGAINLIFVILRTCGAFEDQRFSATWPQAEGESAAIAPLPAPLLQAPYSYSTGLPSPSMAAPDRGPVSGPIPGSPYRFVSWEDEKSKGSSTGFPVSSIGAPAASRAEPYQKHDQRVPASEPGKMSGQSVRRSEAPDGLAQPAPIFGGSRMPNPGGYTATASVPISGGICPKSDASTNTVLSQKAYTRRRNAKPPVVRDPLLTALLALLVPLVFLSAFAICRHYGGSDRGPASYHRVWRDDGSGAASSVVNRR